MQEYTFYTIFFNSAAIFLILPITMSASKNSYFTLSVYVTMIKDILSHRLYFL